CPTLSRRVRPSKRGSNRVLTTPRSRRRGTAAGAAYERRSQALRDQDVADIAAVNAKDAAATTVIAGVGALGSGLAGASNPFNAQPPLRCELAQPGFRLLAKSAFLGAARLDRLRGIEADKAHSLPLAIDPNRVAIGDAEVVPRYVGLAESRCDLEFG